MIIHPVICVLFIFEESQTSLSPFLNYLRLIPNIELKIEASLPGEIKPYDVIVTMNSGNIACDQNRLEQFVQAGGGWLELVHLSERSLSPVLGARPSAVSLRTDLRVMFQNADHLLAARWPDAIYVDGHYQSLEPAAEDTHALLYTDWRYQHRAVLTTRKVGDGSVACTTLQAYEDPSFQQILYRLLRDMAGQGPARQTLNVGLLGYSPHVGKNHGIGIAATPGLEFNAVCDTNPEMLIQAHSDFPLAKTYDSADVFVNDPDLDLVVICTPPNTHARLSMEMMVAGKHVLCEKPLALTQQDVMAMVEMAEKHKVHLSCHQNRRWDVDYLAIKQAIENGLIGELFYMETFVGGYSHPCGYWHSHDEISGGTSFDWGAHYLDWIVSLMPEPVKSVIGTRHKRVWHDVTNADQERIQIRFDGGLEAEFLHSDIAGAPKPKWYLLGTKGAIVGHWRNVTQYELDPLVYYHEHDIPPTEMTPELVLHQYRRSGQMVTRQLELPRRQHHAIYGNIADHLLLGEPITAPVEDSVRVVAILEAAARSAANGGTPETIND
jgi:predicted dehydrogenase